MNHALRNGLLIRSASTDPSATSSSSTSAPETVEGEESEPKLQSPYHFSLSSNTQEGVEGDVHHYHPEPYPEGITDEKVRLSEMHHRRKGEVIRKASPTKR